MYRALEKWTILSKSKNIMVAFSGWETVEHAVFRSLLMNRDFLVDHG